MILSVPGDRDYYSEGGDGFFRALRRLRRQEASFFALRGEHWQILAVDTGILSNFNLLFKAGPTLVSEQLERTMTFLPEDQAVWAKKQLDVGKAKGLKTIVLSHHQLFSRNGELGVANSAVNEAAFTPDALAGTFPWPKEFLKKGWRLPGGLASNLKPAVNTRLASQFPADVLDGVDAWFWGHEHISTIFKPYAGLKRGRLIGNGCVPIPKDHDIYAAHPETVSLPWGGHPEPIDGSQIGTGDNFWNIGFATVTLLGPDAHARYFQLQDHDIPDANSPVAWGPAVVHYEEEF